MPSPGSVHRQPGWWLWSRNPLALILWPLSLIFCLLVAIRRALYRLHWLQSRRLAKPVIVVGNISVGGNGKTPVVVALVRLLQGRGHQPAILTRGYKSDIEGRIVILDEQAHSELAGDEANMLSELCGCPVAVGADRVQAGETLLRDFSKVDVLIADDGLQHYPLSRDMEVIVKRGRALGNGFCLPAGPLREPVSRLQHCDLLIDRDSADVSERLATCWNLGDPQQTRELDSFRGTPVHALAGIGFPELFFDMLRARGLDVEGHAYADHHRFTADDIDALGDATVLVTHKDAVKIRAFASHTIWVVPLELTLSDELQYRFFKILEPKFHG